MSTNLPGNRTAQAVATGRLDRPGAATGAGNIPAPAVEMDVVQTALRDRVRWGPVIAGVVSAFAVLLFLTVLGIALGISAFAGEATPNWGTAAGIWGGLSLLVAFFVGGWMSSRSATTVADGDGPLNGFIAGAATLLLLIWMTTTAVTSTLGFFASTVADVAGAAAPAAMQAVDEGTVPAATGGQTTVGEVVQNPEEAVPPEANQAAQAAAEVATENAAPGAWGTVIAMLLAIVASIIGGMVGQNQRWALPGTRTAVTT